MATAHREHTVSYLLQSFRLRAKLFENTKTIRAEHDARFVWARSFSHFLSSSSPLHSEKIPFARGRMPKGDILGWGREREDLKTAWSRTRLERGGRGRGGEKAENWKLPGSGFLALDTSVRTPILDPVLAFHSVSHASICAASVKNYYSVKKKLVLTRSKVHEIRKVENSQLPYEIRQKRVLHFRRRWSDLGPKMTGIEKMIHDWLDDEVSTKTVGEFRWRYSACDNIDGLRIMLRETRCSFAGHLQVLELPSVATISEKNLQNNHLGSVVWLCFVWWYRRMSHFVQTIKMRLSS